MVICDVIVGLQHGDEGKGKVCYNLIKTIPYQYCLRFNGGPNAGHTIHIENTNTKFVLHQIPCGILLEKPCIIGSGCVVDLDKLETEIKYLEDLGVKFVRELIYIAHNAHVITNQHIITDNNNNKIGTTGCGIGPCYSDKINRKGLVISDFLDKISRMRINIIDIPNYFSSSHSQHVSILAEGAQGFMLDIDWGNYPYCTSSSCLSSNLGTSGIPVTSIRNIYGVCKIYDTYVGNNEDFQPNDDELEQLGKFGNEFGSTTGRKRKCNWLNLSQLKKAIYVNGCNYIIFNKCDIIEKLNIYKLIQHESNDMLYDKHSKNTYHTFDNFDKMKLHILNHLTPLISSSTTNHNLQNITFSNSPYSI